MTLRDRIKVQALDEERTTNIERRIVIGVSEMSMRPAPAKRGLAFAFAGMALAAVAAGIGWKLVTREPEVAVQYPTFVAVAQPPIAIALADQARAEVANASISGTAKLRVAQSPARTVIAMQPGALDFDVTHDPARTLVIRAGDTEIEDVGTKFHVDYDGSHVGVRVTEGEVKVTRASRVVEVVAGNEWSSESGVVAIAEQKSVAAHPAPAHVVSVARPQHAEARAPRVADVATPRPITPSEPAVDPFVELRTAIRKVPLAYAPTMDGHLDAANEVARLKKIAYSPTTLGPEASQAMYQIAVLLYRPLGQDVEAQRTLDVFVRRFHAGKELHAAMWLRVRIACEKSLDESCRRAAYSYQHEVTSSEASDVAIRITNAP